MSSSEVILAFMLKTESFGLKAAYLSAKLVSFEVEFPTFLSKFEISRTSLI